MYLGQFHNQDFPTEVKLRFLMIVHVNVQRTFCGNVLLMIVHVCERTANVLYCGNVDEVCLTNHTLDVHENW